MVQVHVNNELSNYASEIIKEVDYWKAIKENGCNDPAWPDGVNLNLLRNHVIHYKQKILELYVESMVTVPSEYFIPTPPYTDSNYFANPESERAKRIMKRPNWQCANQEQPVNDYNDRQMSLF